MERSWLAPQPRVASNCSKILFTCAAYAVQEETMASPAVAAKQPGLRGWAEGSQEDLQVDHTTPCGRICTLCACCTCCERGLPAVAAEQPVLRGSAEGSQGELQVDPTAPCGRHLHLMHMLQLLREDLPAVAAEQSGQHGLAEGSQEALQVDPTSPCGRHLQLAQGSLEVPQASSGHEALHAAPHAAPVAGCGCVNLHAAPDAGLRAVHLLRSGRAATALGAQDSTRCAVAVAASLRQRGQRVPEMQPWTGCWVAAWRCYWTGCWMLGCLLAAGSLLVAVSGLQPALRSEQVFSTQQLCLCVRQLRCERDKHVGLLVEILLDARLPAGWGEPTAGPAQAA